jgi:hypothetical protein
MGGETDTVPELVLDNVSYPVIESDDVPTGYCEVDVKLDDNGVELPCMMVSGQLAYSVEGEKKDTIRPLASWFMFVKGEMETETVTYVTHQEEETITPTTQKEEEEKEKKTKSSWKFWE